MPGVGHAAGCSLGTGPAFRERSPRARRRSRPARPYVLATWRSGSRSGTPLPDASAADESPSGRSSSLPSW